MKAWEQDEFFWQLGVLKLGAVNNEAVCRYDGGTVLKCLQMQSARSKVPSESYGTINRGLAC